MALYFSTAHPMVSYLITLHNEQLDFVVPKSSQISLLLSDFVCLTIPAVQTSRLPADPWDAVQCFAFLFVHAFLFA